MVLRWLLSAFHLRKAPGQPEWPQTDEVGHQRDAHLRKRGGLHYYYEKRGAEGDACKRGNRGVIEGVIFRRILREKRDECIYRT